MELGKGCQARTIWPLMLPMTLQFIIVMIVPALPSPRFALALRLAKISSLVFFLERHGNRFNPCPRGLCPHSLG